MKSPCDICIEETCKGEYNCNCLKCKVRSDALNFFMLL
jgi:hypothetical protein